MRRALLITTLLLLGLPAPGALYAQQVPNPMSNSAANADQPEALQNLTNQIISLSGGVLRTGPGTEVGSFYGTSAPVVWGIYPGTDAAPVTTAGQQIRIVYRQAVTKDKCFNNQADTGCNSPLLINAIGTAATSMVTSAATLYARSSSTTLYSDVQALNAISDVADDGVGGAMGAYIQGRIRTNTGTGRVFGAEISAANLSNANTCLINTGSSGHCVGIWLAARSSSATTPLDSALQLGTGDGLGFWRHGITINSNAIYSTPNTGTRSFADYSNSEASLYVRGTHSYAMIVDPASGLVGLGTFAPAARLEIGGALSMPTWASAGVALRVASATYTDTTSSGAVGYGSAVSAFLTPTLAAANPTTYTSTATVYIGGCPTSGTNVTSLSCSSLVVGGPAYFVGDVGAPALATVGTIAGSVCRTGGGTFIYKAGANCF